MGRKSVILYSKLRSPHKEVYMKYEIMNEKELAEEVSGAAITLSAVMAVLAAAVVAVVVYKLFVSKKGTTTVPGGWKFTWN